MRLPSVMQCWEISVRALVCVCVQSLKTLAVQRRKLMEKKSGVASAEG